LNRFTFLGITPVKKKINIDFDNNFKQNFKKTFFNGFKINFDKVESIHFSWDNSSQKKYDINDEPNFENLEQIINNFVGLTKLKKFILNYKFKQLQNLPNSICKLTQLTYLSISEHIFTELPEAIGNLTALEILNLYSNKLTALPESFGNLINLRELSLRQNKLTVLPESFGNLINLRELSLRQNKLTVLPESFGNLIHLRELSLNNNELTVLPESFGNLINLIDLNLSNNKLTALHESFGNLIHLRGLILNNNRLTVLPESFGNLTDLTQLILNNNNLTVLPESFGNLIHLTLLILNNNNLTELTNSICSFNDLWHLNIDNNVGLNFICEQTENNYLYQTFGRTRNNVGQTRNNVGRPTVDAAVHVHKVFKTFKFKRLDAKMKANHPEWFDAINDANITVLLFKNTLEKTLKTIIDNDLDDIPIKNEPTERKQFSDNLEFIFKNKLNAVTKFELPQEVIVCCFHVLIYVSHQPKEFKALYATSYLRDVVNAYENINPVECLSCINGMIERIITAFYATCKVMAEYDNIFTGEYDTEVLHLFSFKTPILLGKKIRKNVKSIVGISPTMVLLFPLLFWLLKR